MRHRIDYAVNSEDVLLRTKAYRCARPEQTAAQFNTYWAVNGEAVRERRRAKYHADPEHRARILACNRAWKRKANGSAKKN